jgi:hypothetical protein
MLAGAELLNLQHTHNNGEEVKEKKRTRGEFRTLHMPTPIGTPVFS